MNCVPGVEEFQSPPLLNASTPCRSRSRKRSLFHWRRPSNGSLRPSTRAGHEPVPCLPLSTAQIPRPIPGPRSYSDRSHSSFSDRPRSADNKPTRKLDKIVTDPPPLAQAYRQSLLHAELETPTSFTEKSRHGSSVNKDQHTRCLSEDTIEVKRTHKKSESGDSTCSTRGKIFCLVHGPYVLQYDGDSSGDALPEKILILDRNSVAAACDAVPGRPWVLRISNPHIPLPKGQSLKPNWSKMALRQPEDRRAVNTLLLIFDDSDELYTWLFAMRKEIENLGGIEYRPDTDDKAWRDNLTQKFGSTPVSRKSSWARTTSVRASPSPAGRRGCTRTLPRVRPHSNQSSVSSKHTSTSLDRFRDSVASDGYTSTLATSCADGSASSPSPIYETFPSIKSVTDHTSGDLSLRTYTSSDDTSPRLSMSPKPSQSLLERRKLSVSSLHLAGQEETKDRGRKFLLDLPSTISASPDEALPPMISSIPQDTSNAKDAMSLQTDVQKSKHESADSSKKDLMRKTSAAESSTSARKPKYSLFPACPPSEIRQERLADPSKFLQPLVIPKIVESHHDTRSRTYPGTENRHQKSESRTVTLELRQHRISTLLGAGEYSQAQRSPVMTDSMFFHNFGITRNDPPASPMPEIRVPGLVDLKFDMDFLRTPYRAPSNSYSPASKNRRTPSLRSVSSSRHERSTSFAKVPAGPPPAGPLPAVPVDSRWSSGTNRSSQQSQTQQSDQHEAEKTQEVVASHPVRTSSKNAMSDERVGQHRRQTTSNTTEGLALRHVATCIQEIEPTTQSRSRSRSRGRQRSANTHKIQ